MLLLMTGGVSAAAILTTDAGGGKVADHRRRRRSEASTQRSTLDGHPSLITLSRRVYCLITASSGVSGTAKSTLR